MTSSANLLLTLPLTSPRQSRLSPPLTTTASKPHLTYPLVLRARLLPSLLCHSSNIFRSSRRRRLLKRNALPPIDCAIRYRTVPPALSRSSPFNFMQLGPTEISTLARPTSASLALQSSHQHGFQQLHPIGPASGSSLPQQGPARGGSGAGVSTSQLEERLHGLNHAGPERPVAPGHRILEYENALTPSTPRQALGFKVVRRAHPTEGGAQLTDFPNGESDRWPARAPPAVFGY